MGARTDGQANALVGMDGSMETGLVMLCLFGPLFSLPGKLAGLGWRRFYRVERRRYRARQIPPELNINFKFRLTLATARVFIVLD